MKLAIGALLLLAPALALPRWRDRDLAHAQREVRHAQREVRLARRQARLEQRRLRLEDRQSRSGARWR